MRRQARLASRAAGFAVLIASATVAMAQAGTPLGGKSPRSDARNWNSYFDRLNQPAGGGLLTDSLDRGPLDRDRDPLDPANLRLRSENPQPEGSLVPGAGNGDPLRPD